jgi:hypothetical protein
VAVLVDMWMRLAASWRISFSSTSLVFRRSFTIMGGANVAGPTDTSSRLAALRELMNKDPKVDA